MKIQETDIEKGFTLVEILAGLVIFSVLAFLFSDFQGSAYKSRIQTEAKAGTVESLDSFSSKVKRLVSRGHIDDQKACKENKNCLKIDYNSKKGTKTAKVSTICKESPELVSLLESRHPGIVKKIHTQLDKRCKTQCKGNTLPLIQLQDGKGNDQTSRTFPGTIDQSGKKTIATAFCLSKPKKNTVVAETIGVYIGADASGKVQGIARKIVLPVTTSTSTFRLIE